MKIDNLINYVTCADIGGSHITAAVIRLDNWSIVEGSYVRKEINSKGGKEEIFNTWIDVIKSANSSKGAVIQKVALAMPGPFDYVNGISYITGLSKYEAIYGLNIRQIIAEHLDISAESIRFRNDAESTIAGEMLCGAGKGFHNVVGLTLGTGFGSAHFSSNNCIDLNFGSHPYRESIADDFFSTRWFIRSYFDKTGLSLTDGVRELAIMAKTNKTTKKIFREFAANMTEFLIKPIGDINPDLLLLCGNIAKAYPLFLPYLRKHLNTPVGLAELSEYAPLIGAAAMFHPKVIEIQSLNK